MTTHHFMIFLIDGVPYFNLFYAERLT